MDAGQRIYLLLLLITFALGCSKWRMLLYADKVLVILIGLTFLQETAANLVYTITGSNAVTYHIYSPIEFFLLCLYFNDTNPLFKKNRTGIVIGVSGVLLSIGNTIWLQHVNTFNSYYLLFEGTCIVILCLLSLCGILLDEQLDFKRQPYFWVTLCLLFYWCLTFTSWGVYNLLDDSSIILSNTMEVTLYTANVLLYACIATVFFNYKKLIHSV